MQSIRWLGDRKGIENITETWGETVVGRKARKAVQDEQYPPGSRGGGYKCKVMHAARPAANGTERSRGTLEEKYRNYFRKALNGLHLQIG